MRRSKPLERQLEALRQAIESGGTGGGGVGPPGPKGDKGDIGPTGADGQPGIQGERGPSGPKGDKGETGDAGPVGPAGSDGSDGATGPQGERGETGLTGSAGPKGDKGDTGNTGPAGPQGDPGPPGADSQVPGPTGLTGPKGDRGDPGINGAPGEDGASAYQVAVANGFVGSQAAWLASLVGPPGEDGSDGQQGIQGNPGPAGSFPSSTSALGADVQLPSSNTFVNGPSLTLEAGTYLIVGTATFQRNATTAVHWIARISDGTNHHASSQTYQGSVSGHTASISLSAIVALAGQTTLRLQGAVSVGSTTSLMKAAVPNAASGNNATRLSAVKIA